MVSIRSRHRCRENRGHWATRTSATMFQSAPGIDAGRIQAGEQPGPGDFVSIRSRHRCRENLKYLIYPHPGSVSIRSRHRCRENHRPAWIRAEIFSFNPLPASMPGESLAWAAKGIMKRFQSAPGIDAGRILHLRQVRAVASVSIRSRHRCRENLSRMRRRSRPLGFNPLPASMPGESSTLHALASI